LKLKIAMFFSVFLVCISCTHDKGTLDFITDEELFKLSVDSVRVYYQNGNILTPAGNSPHGKFKLYFNTIAQSVLDSTTLELPANKKFPNGSLISKEVYSGTTVLMYAVMYKYRNNWVWAEYRPSGNTIFSVNKKGGVCINCHSETPNRDLVRTFDLH